MFTPRISWVASVICSLGLLAGVAIIASPESSVRADETQRQAVPKDIIDTATGPGMEDVTTLVKAIKAAGLVDVLKGPGPFTVFAPTNAAFDKLPPADLAKLMQPDHQQDLAKILKYHLVSGNLTAKDVMGQTELKSLDDDKTLKIQTLDDKTLVNDAKIIKADIKCSNGTIHWIDTVLMPG